ncbi:mechanosensitive ion channel domain-containing protein [Aestuariirhabdus litorea]|uniref:Mechanosensitive ion channel protein MscS n=1 Tax=Aestuariirhabdus litorea TaxID=2528527 RepID=A0A3P3VQJ9_9GAMM|nr:mechanosensitive ion channel domain-containing protein [Aestuariirhabdus litorea]RRJ83809.1 hypothetical protein D0544_01435 [Aestuariirhabdus litorea]RWW97032.1 mechanosensitive ion channel [Endozoicomonadaceae bacterium GTF-13]
MRALLLSLFILLFPAVALGAEGPLANLPVIKIQKIEPGWWSVLEGMNSEERASYLKGIESQFRTQLDSSSDLNTQQTLKLIYSLMDRVIKGDDTPLVIANLPLKNDSYSIPQWLELFQLQVQYENQLLTYRHRQERLATFIDELRRSIANDLVSYRATPEASIERLQLAALVVRNQLELVISRHQNSRLTNAIAQLEARQKELLALQEFAVRNLTPTPERQKGLQEQLDKLQKRIESNSVEAYKAKLRELTGSTTAQPSAQNIDERLSEFQTYAQWLNLRAQQGSLDLELMLERGLSGTHLPLPPPQKAIWSELESLLQKADSNFTDLLTTLDITASSDKPSRMKEAWNSLSEARQMMQSVAYRSRQTNYLFSGYETVALAQRSWWEPEKFALGRLLKQAFTGAYELWDYPIFLVNEAPVTIASLSGFMLILLLAFVASSLIRKGISRVGQSRTTVSESALFTIGRILHYIIITAGLLIGFSALGLDFSNLAIIAGALGVGIGFGLQSIFNNFISGLILLFERPLKVGDLVELESGVRGRIKSINVRSTQIATWDNIDILVPNSEFISGRVTNYTYTDDLRRLHVPFGVAYGTDKEQVKAAAIEAALTIDYTLNTRDRGPDVWLVNMGESSLDFELVVWIRGNRLPKHTNPIAAYLWAIETSLGAHNIEIPFPQRDLHLRSVDDKLLARYQPPQHLKGTPDHE